MNWDGKCAVRGDIPWSCPYNVRVLPAFWETTMRYSLRLVAVLAVLGLTSAAFAEQIDNPEYAQWSKYKAGTFVSLRQSTEMPGMADMPGMPPGMDMAAMMPQITITTKLTEVKPDALTLEVTTATSQMGQTRETKTTRSVPAKIDKPTTTPAATQGATAEMKNLKEGKDTVEVKSKKLETVTREYDTTVTQSSASGAPTAGRGGDAPMAAHMKVWTSADVPGGMVKSETTAKVQDAGYVKSTLTLVDYAVVK
jgi:hypothetical protein